MKTTIVIKPRVSEKAYSQSQSGNTYVFDVPLASGKHQIAAAVRSQYSVSVVSVRIASVPGKSQRNIRRGRLVGSSKRRDIKKAYVTLKEGDSLPFFAAETEEPKAKKTKENK